MVPPIWTFGHCDRAPGARSAHADDSYGATFQVPYRVFAPATAVAAVLWTLLYYFSGAFLGQQWQKLVASLAANLDDVAELIVFLVLIAIAVGVVIRHRRAACQKGAVRSDATHPV